MHKERENWLQFTEQCYNKFLVGEKKYKGKWKKYSVNREMEELRQEVEDIVVYAFFINEKLKKLEVNKNEKIDKRTKS